MSKTNKYCGIGEAPKGKKRGDAEYCAKANQVRYYGLHKIDRDLLKAAKAPSLDGERLKLAKLNQDAIILVKEFKKNQAIINDPEVKPVKIKLAEKKRMAMLKKRNILKKKIIDQAIFIEELEKQQKRAKKGGCRGDDNCSCY